MSPTLPKISTLITVRTSSSRLPSKCFEKIGEYTVVEYIVKRASYFNLEPIICTSTETNDNLLETWAKSKDIKIFRGPLENKIKRWAECCKFFNLSNVHILDCDDPFFDPEEVQKSMQFLVDKNLDLVLNSNRSDDGFASVGISITSDFLNLLTNRTQKLGSQNFDVIPWKLLIKPHDKVIRLDDNVLIPQKLFNLRLTLDYPEDLVLLNLLALKFSPESTRIEIESFLAESPEIMNINMVRQHDFLLNKKKILQKNFGLKEEI